jgi:hypothetical protein
MIMAVPPFALLERFTEKWNPVFGHEARQTKELEYFTRFRETVKGSSRGRMMRPSP